MLRKKNWDLNTWNCKNATLFLDTFTKLRKATMSFVMSVRPSVRPHGTTLLPLDGFPWNLIFEYFDEKLSTKFVIKIEQEW